MSLPLRLQTLFFSKHNKDFEQKLGRGLVAHLIHCQPNIYIIDNVLTRGELSQFDKVISDETQFKASLTESKHKVGRDPNRKSSYVSLGKQSSKTVRQVECRVSDICGIGIENIEPLQLVRYKAGDFFGLHHDAGTYNEITGEVIEDPPKRLLTLFVYLNDLPIGEGETVFPKLNIKVQPRRGRAVFWSNVLEDGTLDPLVVHRADRVSKGLEKYGINIWVTNQNMLFHV
jgi:prolyl 4-hydroxylase